MPSEKSGKMCATYYWRYFARNSFIYSIFVFFILFWISLPIIFISILYCPLTFNCPENSVLLVVFNNNFFMRCFHLDRVELSARPRHIHTHTYTKRDDSQERFRSLKRIIDFRRRHECIHDLNACTFTTYPMRNQMNCRFSCEINPTKNVYINLCIHFQKSHVIR